MVRRSFYAGEMIRLERQRISMANKMFNLFTWAVLLLSLLLSGIAASQKENPSTNFEKTRKLLLDLDDIKSDRETLAMLFHTGDERIEHLIKALDDPDERIRLRAQVIIRYLGNETGMRALVESYEKRKETVISGPVPLPLNNWDYTYIETNYVHTPASWDMLSERYIYALALDDSQTAKTKLKEVIKAAENLAAASTIKRAIKLIQENPPDKLLTVQKDIGKTVLQNAFFVESTDRKYTSARLLAFNGVKDKALVELYINRGVLAEEWYHVVISNRGQGWKFFSITQVAVS